MAVTRRKHGAIHRDFERELILKGREFGGEFKFQNFRKKRSKKVSNFSLRKGVMLKSE